MPIAGASEVACGEAVAPFHAASDLVPSAGATQRLVVELTPSGPKIRNALPGGAVMSSESPYFANDAELWLRNQTRNVPFEIDDVAAAIPAGGQHILFSP